MARFEIGREIILEREHDRYCTRNDERVETKRLNIIVVSCRISNM